MAEMPFWAVQEMQRRDLENDLRELKRKIWEIMGRGVKQENELGDNISIELDIDDWRELCEIVNFGR